MNFESEFELKSQTSRARKTGRFNVRIPGEINRLGEPNQCEIVGDSVSKFPLLRMDEGLSFDADKERLGVSPSVGYIYSP